MFSIDVCGLTQMWQAPTNKKWATPEGATH